jgi:hypothetical protein
MNVPSGTDVVNVEADTTSGFADHSAVLQGIVDTLDRVVLHTDQEA